MDKIYIGDDYVVVKEYLLHDDVIKAIIGKGEDYLEIENFLYIYVKNDIVEISSDIRDSINISLGLIRGLDKILDSKRFPYGWYVLEDIDNIVITGYDKEVCIMNERDAGLYNINELKNVNKSNGQRNEHGDIVCYLNEDNYYLWDENGVVYLGNENLEWRHSTETLNRVIRAVQVNYEFTKNDK